MSARFWHGREVLKEYKQGRLVYEKQTSIPDYLCFTALEAGQFTLTIPAAVTPTYLSYVEWSKDGRTWTHTDNTSEAVTIDVQVAQGDKVYWRGSGESMGTAYTAANMSRFSSDARFNISGHIISLLKGDDLIDHLEHYNTSHIRNATFAQLFNDCTTLVDASELSLPTFTSYSSYIFYRTFHGCTSLIAAPALPSLQTATQCYRGTFQGCTSLVTAPSIAATILNGTGELYQTFQGCTALVTPPSDLWPTTLNSVSYYQTFQGCNHMTTMPTLHFTSLASNANHACYQMFSGCSLMEGEVAIDVPHAPHHAFCGMFGSCKITKAYVRCPSADQAAFMQTFFNMPTLADIDIVGATTLGGTQVYQSCFYGCRATRMNIVLPAGTLTDECYKQMFYTNGGTINHITCLATDISATDCTLNWLLQASSTGTFIQVEGVTWPRGASGIPTGWVDVEKRTMPSGYKQVEYLSNPNYGYININRAFEANAETLEIAFVKQATGASQPFGNSTYNYSYGSIKVAEQATALAVSVGVDYANKVYKAVSIASVSADEPHTLKYVGSSSGFQLYLDGVSKSTQTCAWDAVNPFAGNMVFSNSTNASKTAYFHTKPIYYLKIWDGNGVLALDYVPCIRKSDNVAGFYDMANNVFHKSDNANDFTAGEEI